MKNINSTYKKKLKYKLQKIKMKLVSPKIVSHKESI